MKKVMLLSALVLSVFITKEVAAQVAVSVNIGAQPVWGPVGYDYANYYYLPDVDAYYDVPARVFVYNEGGVWVRRPALPPAFAGYDLYHGYKVVINDPNPWLRHTEYRDRFIVYKGRRDQEFIRDSRAPRYYEINEHPMHSQWHGENHVVNHPDGQPVNNHPVNHGGGGGGENHKVEHGGNGGGHGHGNGKK